MIFITGGVRSGKSSYAEKRALQIKRNGGSQLHYVATSRIYDSEMKRRVQLHQRDRDNSGENWNVHEQPQNIEQLLPQFKQHDIVLLDCVTTLVSNEYFAFSKTNEEMWHHPHFLIEVERNLQQLFKKMAKLDCEVIIVSNEIFNDLPTEYIHIEKYKKMLGNVHQQIVALASEAIIVEYGIPCWKKGEEQCLG